MVCDLGIACYVCWETIHTNHLPARPRLSTKTYENIYTTIQYDTRPRFTTNTTGSERMGEMAWLPRKLFVTYGVFWIEGQFST